MTEAGNRSERLTAADDRRRGYRRIPRGHVQPALVSPEQLSALGALALPSEREPLVWQPGRGPITEDEALGAARRRQRASGEAELMEELPSGDRSKQPTVFRLPPRGLAFARARAEIERTTLTAVIEAALTEYAYGPPQEPDVVRAHQLKLIETTMAAQTASPSGPTLPSTTRDDAALAELRRRVEDLTELVQSLMDTPSKGKQAIRTRH